jgi:hypothetical protein
MKKAAIGVVFLLGCAVGGLSSQFVAPGVRAGTNPTRWEYYCIADSSVEMAKFDKLGAQGWEMVTGLSYGLHTGNLLLCFKRPLA